MSKTKEEAVKFLIEKGFDAEYQHGIVSVFKSEMEMQELTKILHDADYDASFGLFPSRDKTKQISNEINE